MLIAAFTTEVRFQHRPPLTHWALRENIGAGERPWDTQLVPPSMAPATGIAPKGAPKALLCCWTFPSHRAGCFHLAPGHPLSPQPRSEALPTFPAALRGSAQLLQCFGAEERALGFSQSWSCTRNGTTASTSTLLPSAPNPSPTLLRAPLGSPGVKMGPWGSPCGRGAEWSSVLPSCPNQALLQPCSPHPLSCRFPP